MLISYDLEDKKIFSPPPRGAWTKKAAFQLSLP